MKTVRFWVSLVMVLGTFGSNADPLDVCVDRGNTASSRISAFALGEGLIIGVGLESNIVTSVDGVHWIVRGADPGNTRSDNFFRAAYGNRRFVAAGAGFYEYLPVWSS